MDPNANVAEQLVIARDIVADAGVPHEKASDAELDASRAEHLAELVLALDEWRSKGGFAPTDKRVKWNFWLPDSDRSTGWTNHGYVLQFVCAGYGHTPEEAWESAKRGDAPDCGVPEDFELPDRVTAIREDAERPLEVE